MSPIMVFLVILTVHEIESLRPLVWSKPLKPVLNRPGRVCRDRRDLLCLLCLPSADESDGRLLDSKSPFLVVGKSQAWVGFYIIYPMSGCS